MIGVFRAEIAKQASLYESGGFQRLNPILEIGFQPVPRRDLGIAEDEAQLALAAIEICPEHLGSECFLAREVLVERALGYIGALDNALDAGGGITFNELR